MLPISWTKKSLHFRLCLTLGLLPGQASTLLTSDTNTDTVLRATPSQTLSVYVERSLPPCAATLPQSLKRVEAGASDAPASNSRQPRFLKFVMVVNQPVSVLVPASDQFAARLAKVVKQLAKLSGLVKTTSRCYRVYDAVFADYAVGMSIYKGATKPTTWLQISGMHLRD